MWFGHLFKVFRSVSLDLTGYVASYGSLEASKFVCKICCQLHYRTLKVRFYVVKIFFALIT